MRSSWSADRLLALLAAASLEAAWLTLAYLALQWLAGSGQQYLGIAHLAVAAIAGLLLGRVLRGRPRSVYAGALVAVAILAAIVGIWLAAAPRLSPSTLVAATKANPAGWLLGIGVLRGSTHAALDDEAGHVERFLNAGLAALAVFWLFASTSGLTGAETFRSTAFAATLTSVSAGLLSLGLARLTELRVEGVDRAARRRWLIMLVAVSGAVLAIGIPLAALLGVPVSAALAGIAGPLAPVVLLLIALIVVPLGLLAELLHRLLPPMAGAPFPSLGPVPGTGAPSSGPAPTGFMLDLSWVIWVILAVAAALALLWVASLLRRPVLGDEPDKDAEVRESEPIGDGLLPRLPRLQIRLRRPRRLVPRTAPEAYRLALALLVGRDEERRAGETPREHAHRIALTAVGPSIGSLAADYQLSAFAGRSLTAAEERRAVDRWRRVERFSRSASVTIEGRDRSG